MYIPSAEFPHTLPQMIFCQFLGELLLLHNGQNCPVSLLKYFQLPGAAIQASIQGVGVGASVDVLEYRKASKMSPPHISPPPAP